MRRLTSPMEVQVGSFSMPISMEDDPVKVRAKSERKSAMTDAATMTRLTRSALSVGVEKEQRALGSRMAAYERVAATVGASASWVRDFLSNSQRAKQPDWTVGWNILSAYGAMCERVERAAEKEVVRAHELKREIDAVTESVLQVVAGATREKAASSNLKSEGEEA